MADLETIWQQEDAVPPGGPSGSATNGDDIIIGDNNDNILGSSAPNTGNGADEIYGAGGNDTLNGGNGADTLYGGAGIDTLNGDNGEDELYGGSGDDTLKGGGANDILVGGKDNDTLTGGSGDDEFVFRFCLTESNGASDSFTDWLTDHGYAQYVVSGLVADNIPQNVFASQYTAWLNYLVQEYGLGEDTDGDGIINVGLNQNDSDPDATPWIEGVSAEDLMALFDGRDDLIVKTGKVTQERYYSNIFSTGDGETTLDGEGYDIINDFRHTGAGNDTMRFQGLTTAQFDQLVADGVISVNLAATADANGVADDTVISWDGGSITLLGQTFGGSLATLKDAITFDDEAAA